MCSSYNIFKTINRQLVKLRRSQPVTRVLGVILKGSVGILLVVSLTCEKLSGRYSQEMMGLVLGGLLNVELHSHTFSKLTYYFKTTK